MFVLDTALKYAAIGGLVALSTVSAKLWYDNGQLELALSKANETIATERSQYDTERATQADNFAKLTEQYRLREANWATDARALEVIRDENIRLGGIAANAVRERLRADKALSSLRAASKESSAPQAATLESYPAGSIGELLGPRAEPMVGIAERADVLKEFLIECRTMYDNFSARQE